MAIIQNTTTDPSKVSTRFAAVAPQWRLVDALKGGTETMRAAGSYLLPRDTLEGEEQYQVRLSRTTLFNAYRRSLQQGVARLFAKDLALTSYPSLITIWAQDVDAQGRDITQFTKFTFEDALNRGVSYIHIDYPDVDYTSGENQITYTQADALKDGNRPYWVNIEATQVLAAHSKLLQGVERLTHFRFKETVLEVSDNGLDEDLIEQIKIYNQAGPDEPIELQVWRNQTKGWEMVAQKIIKGPPTIPVVPIYTNRTSYMLGSPPLMDLAEMNILHWQSSSEQRNILHFARVPFLHINGWNATKEVLTDLGGIIEEPVELNVHRALTTNDPTASAKWVETNGNGLQAGADDLKSLEEKMDALGLSLAVPKSGGVTATETSVNAAEANSQLKDMARALSDSLEQCLYLTSFYLGAELSPDAPGRVEVDTSFAVDLQPTPPAKTPPPAQTTPTQEPAPKVAQTT